jgi:hypothetical protein
MLLVRILLHLSGQSEGRRCRRQARKGDGPSTRTRVLTAHGTRGQTHDDYQWLDEEDGEEYVLRNVRGRNWCNSAPAVAQNESRHRSRNCDPRPQNGAGDRDDECRARLAGVFVFSGCAAVVCLRLGDLTGPCEILRVSLVHWACALGAARHARLRSRRPSRTHGRVAT